MKTQTNCPVSTKFILYIILFVALNSFSKQINAHNEMIKSGSFIISMGASNPRTITNGLMPYGLNLVASSNAGTISCYGGTTTVTVSATGGTSPYTGTGTFTVHAGPYSYTVTDANGNTAVTSGTIVQPALLTSSAGTDKIIYSGGNTVIGGSTTGGTMPYAYAWTPVTGLSASNIANPLASPSVTTTYTVAVTDANGCTASSKMVLTVLQPTFCNCSLSYPNNDDLPRSAVVFNESAVLRAIDPDSANCGPAGGVIKVWYNDERALTLGVDTVVVKTSGGTTKTSYAITPTPSTPGCFSNPLVGTTIQAGDQTGNDIAAGGGRPLWPAMFVTDLTVNGPNSHIGDWQMGGTGIAPTRVCGTWKAAKRIVDYTQSPFPKITIDQYNDPAQNHWSGIPDTPPGGFAAFHDEGYGAEVSWDVGAIGLNPYHSYRLQFMIHDGDQNHAGGDAGEACTIINVQPVGCQMTLTALGSQISCYNATDGTVTATASGGITPYTYSITVNGITTNQSSNVFSGLGSGSYIITATDAKGCSVTGAPVIINNPHLLTATAVGSSQVSCHNVSDGMITVTATGGTGAYSYSLNGGAHQNSNIFSGLGSGSYNITVFDAKGCSFSTGSTIVISNPPTLSASAVGSSQVSCHNGGDGTITVTATGGTGTYSYSLNGGVAQSSNIFGGLAAGSYNITVYDANGCSVSTGSAIVISNPPTLSASAVGSSQVSCHNGGDGTITVTATGGTGAYSYSLNGGVAQSSNIFGGLAAGSYNIMVYDANGCSVSTGSAIVISNPPTLSASAVGSSQVSCHNGGDGTITVTATGGTGAYSYSLNGGVAQSSNIFGGLAAGSYNITVYDAKGCSVSTGSAIVISNPPTLSASAVGSSQVSCHNGGDGTITVTATGGTGAYSYSLNGGVAQSSNIFGGLAAGSYNITVYDAKGCSVSTGSAIVISNPPTLSASAVGSSQVSCHNGGDGTITVTATGGTGAYSYSLNGGVAQSSNIFGGLAAGSYNIMVYDAKGCSVSTGSAIVISNPPTLSASAVGSSQVSCHNGGDGTITVTATGGTGAYSYSLNGGVAQSSNIFGGLAAGSYNITVYDAKGCSVSTGSAIVISNPPTLSASAVGSSQVSCHNGGDGTITVTATGGTGAYSYSLNGRVAESSNIFGGLAAGSYNITVYDAKGCSVSTGSTIVISNPPTLSASAVGSSQVSCHNGGDGTITVTATGGTGAYSYSLNGGTAQSSNVFSGLTSGSYSIIVTDAKGCSASTGSTIVILNPPSLTASAVGSAQVSCHSTNDGVITVTASGGTGIYTYSLNGGTPQSSNVFSGLGSGSYSITVFDSKGCSASTGAPIVISNPSSLTASAVGSSQVSCYNANDGVITVTAVGGTGAYAYILNGGAPQSSNVFYGLHAGSYSVTVIDAEGCSFTTGASIVIVNPALLSASATGSSQVSCNNADDGVIIVSASGGTGAYSYSINGGPPQSSDIFFSLPAGSYSITVFDANGCSVTTESNIVISNPPLLTASAVGSSQVGCHNASDGMITVTAAGGTGAYAYSLNGSTPQNSNIFSGLSSGTYNITVFDAEGCSVTTGSTIVISNPPLLTASAVGSSQVSCHNAGDGMITVTAAGGTGSYAYILNGGTPQSSNIFSGLSSGSYSITVFDAKGCSVTTGSVIVISNPPLLTASAAGSSQVSCHNGSDGMITVTATGGTGAYSYSLNGGNAQSSNVFSGLGSGSYNIIVYDAKGCSVSTGATIIISNPPTLSASAVGSSQVSCHNGGDGTITVTATGGTGAYSYSLNGGVAQSSNIFGGLAAGSYNIMVYDANGCSVSTGSAIVISNPPTLSASAVGSSQVSCHNGGDGTITVTATGGTGAYSYSLNGGVAQSSNIFGGLAAGSYNITVYDAKGCSVSTGSAIVISNPPTLSASAVGSSQVSCHNGGDGTITVTATGGTGAYSYSLNGGVAQSSNIFGGLAAGSYNITVYDAKGCSVSTGSAIVISNPPTLSASAVGSSQVSCHNGGDGTITVTATGGTGAYTYSLNGGTAQSSNVFSGLTSGSYSILVTDAKGCSASAGSTIVILNPPSLMASAVGTSQVSCHDAGNGVITVTASGGTGTYTYSLNGGTPQSSNVFSGLGSGSYSITVFDSKGCSASTGAPIIISNPSSLTASAVGSSQVSCYNANDGVITVTASGGTGVYSYSLNGGSAQTSNIFSGLGSGTYNVTVIDAEGCSFSTGASIIITNPALLIASATGSSQVSCHNAGDGVITVAAAGGTGAYSYSLNGGIPQNSNIFSGLSSGSYNIIVFDAEGCSVSTGASIIIANPTLLTASATGSSQVSCYNASDGVITVTAAGGTGAYSYSLNGGAIQSSSIFSGLGSGSYSVTVYDAKGCSASTGASIIIANPALLSASAIGSSQVSCFNASDGVITVTAAGGTGAYSYSLNGGTAQSSNMFSGLAAGSYSILVTDAKGCTAFAGSPIIISNPPLLSATLMSSPQVSCTDSSDGYITVTASGGTGTYYYSLNGGTPQISNVFSGLPSGSYTVMVYDANQCVASNLIPVVVTISNPPPIDVTEVNTPQVSCHDAHDGVITVTASGGTGPFTYSLNGGPYQTSNVFSGLPAGSYIVTVLDQNGCEGRVILSSGSITIFNPPLLTVTATGSSQVSCNNASDGVITATAQGGTGNYSFSLNGGIVQSSGVFSNLPGGTYNITVYDANNCSASIASPITIYNPPLLTLSAAGSSQVSCYNASDGVITATATGGTGIYEYSINNGAGQVSNVFSGLGSGSYIVTVYDENGCSASLTSPISISNPPLLAVTATGSSQVTCYNNSDGVITVTATGGTGAYSYTLNGGPVQTSNVFSGLPGGTYSITVYDANNCSASIASPITISNPPLLTLSAVGSSQVSCYNASDGVITATATGGTGAYEYSINGGTLQTSNVFSGLPGGTYSITVYDANNCSASADSPITISNPSLLSVSVAGSSQVSCYNASDGVITATAQGGTGGYSFSINNGALQASNVFSNLSSGTYIVQVFDENGCSATASVINIANPQALSVHADASTLVSCNNGNDGIISVIATGGTGDLSYSLNGGSFQSSNLFNNLPAGLYSITVQDINNCSITETGIPIKNPDPISFSVSQIGLKCFGVNTGRVVITAQGGTGPYEYSIDGGQSYSSDNTFDGLPAVTLNIYVKDSNNCLSELQVFPITQEDSIMATIDILSANKCNGIADAVISVDISNQGDGYTYSLDGGAPVSSNVFSNVSAGQHTISIYTTKGCKADKKFLIDEQSAIELSLLSSANANCVGLKDGALKVEASGGSQPYSYRWFNGATSPYITGLDAGRYDITVTDSNGCEVRNYFPVQPGTAEVPLKINNAFSPNGDGINDTWVIENIQLYPENELVVLNRWGNEVYSVKGYQNDWGGSGLAEGTYYYILKINLCSGPTTFKDYITILR